MEGKIGISVCLCISFLTLSFYPAVLLVASDTDPRLEDCIIRMSQEMVIKTAEYTAKSNEVALEDYEMKRVSFEFIDRKWTVNFDEKRLSFDGCFSIIVDDRSGESEFRPCP